MIRILLEIFKRYPFAQKKIFLGLGIGILLALLGMNLFISPDLSGIKNNKALVAEAVKRKVSLLDSVPLQAKLQEQRQLLSATKEPAWMIRAVQDAATSSGLSLVSVTPQSLEKADDFEKISLLVEGSGGYHQIGKFMEIIENFKPGILLGQLRLEKHEATLSAKGLKVYLLLKAYHEIPVAAQ